jgi:hypothetical protein
MDLHPLRSGKMVTQSESDPQVQLALPNEEGDGQEERAVCNSK